LFLQLDKRYSLDQIIAFTFDFFMRGLQVPEGGGCILPGK